MGTSAVIQMSGYHSRSVQPAMSVPGLYSQVKRFVDLVLSYQTDFSTFARKAVEKELADSFPRDCVRAFLCLLETADEQTVRRFACTHLHSVEDANQASVSVVIRPNPNAIGSWGNKGRFFILTQKEGMQTSPLHFTNQASAVYYLMYLIHRLQVTSDLAAPISLKRNREMFIKLYHQVYDIEDTKLRARVERLLHREVDGNMREGRQNELRRDIRRHLEDVCTFFGESARPYVMTAKEHLTIPPHLIRFEGEAQRLLEFEFI